MSKRITEKLKKYIPLVSIIVPCYNQSKYLDEALQSVFDQSYENWECIIVNDGSFDNTEEVALKWCCRNSRFKYTHKINGGLSSARNAGLQIATGDFIQFLDSDDLLHHKKLEEIFSLKYFFDIYICDYIAFADGTGEEIPSRYLSPFFDLKTIKEDIIQQWEITKSIPCHCVVFRKEIMDNNNLKFLENLPNHEDWCFWVTLFSFSEKFINIPFKHALYRIRKDSMCSNEKLMEEGFLMAAYHLKKYFKNANQKKLYEKVEIRYSMLKKEKSKKLFKRLKQRLKQIFKL